ncbi:Uncharacterised protein [Achromobacter xylosoxidans]|uniref:capsid staple protein n=1 Tax=Alcaligenes xylosoxydans xylosoxydans TaxID=85698 RepID=UPI0006C1FBFF|nr:hypothetical protein [Achromobacter xylosoxidans]MCM2575070.1 hypothetical protein [Achromobacter xylosoxidans]CUI38286.1 Uncharacterised protein [Achromobacter xylosoxidans]
MNLIDMKLSPEEAKEMDCSAGCLGAEDGGPKYPWGLILSLDDDTLRKLGVSELPKVGQQMHLMAVVEVCTTSQHANQEGTDKCVSLQITQLGLEGAGPDAAQMLYG